MLYSRFSETNTDIPKTPILIFRRQHSPHPQASRNSYNIYIYMYIPWHAHRFITWKAFMTGSSDSIIVVPIYVFSETISDMLKTQNLVCVFLNNTESPPP